MAKSFISTKLDPEKDLKKLILDTVEENKSKKSDAIKTLNERLLRESKYLRKSVLGGTFGKSDTNRLPGKRATDTNK